MDDNLPLLDAHALVVAPDRTRYPFDPAAKPFEPAEQAVALSAEGLLTRVERAVLVQRNRFYGVDNSYVCDAAAAHRDRLKAVCAVDGRDPACAERARFWLARGAAAFRFMEVGRRDDLDWLASDAAQEAWRIAADAGAPVQVHFFPWNRDAGLPALERLAKAPFIIDALPDAGADDLLRAAADLPGAHLKITSSVLARVGDAASLVRQAVGVFGADRMLWGSDLFAPTLAYDEALRVARAAVRSLPVDQQPAILGGSAARLFGFVLPKV